MSLMILTENLPEGTIPLFLGDKESSLRYRDTSKGREIYGVTHSKFNSQGQRVLVYGFEKILTKSEVLAISH